MSALAGYAALHPIARLGSAVSEEAKTIRMAASELLRFSERSVALFGPKAGAISKIWALVNECADVGWDGDEAEPISDIAAEAAADFIRALPYDIPLPEFAPEPDGSISLDWIKSRSRVFTLSVGRTSRLAYAWLDGADKGHAVAHFDRETVPPMVLEGIRMTINQVLNHGDASIQLA